MTRILFVTLLVISLVGTLTEKRFGVGVSSLNFQVPKVLAGEVWRLFTYPFVESSPLNLIISLLILWLFGSWFESRWGQRDFLKFFVLSSVGAALLAIPIGMFLTGVIGLKEIGIGEGPGAARDAMLVAMAMTAPDSNILFGFVLPMRARTVVFVLLGIQVVFAIQGGASAFSMTLGGMGMGYLLVTGKWRPSRILQGARRMSMRRRHGLHVVPPRDRTLH